MDGVKKLSVVTQEVAGAFGAVKEQMRCKAWKEQRGAAERCHPVSDIRKKTMKPSRADLLGFEMKIPVGC